MADFNLPSLTSSYSDFLTYIKARDEAAVTMLSTGTHTNLPTNSIKWDSTNKKWTTWSGTAWSDLATTYSINVNQVDGCDVNDGAVASTNVLWTSNKVNTLMSSYYTKTEINSMTADYAKIAGNTVTADMVIGTDSNYALKIETNNANRVVVGSTGNVTINAPTTGAALQITGATGADSITATTQITGSTLKSTVATGTAPFTVASTTLVTNLNADLLDGNTGSYYTNMDNASAGTLATARGGTGLSTFTAGGAVYATSSTALSSGTLPTTAGGTGLTAFTANKAIYSTSTSALTSGTLPTSAGGTGLASFTANSAIYASSTSALASGTLPVAAGGTGVTSSTGTGNVVLSASPTFSGTVEGVGITLSGTLTANTVSAGTLTETSARRFKENIADISSARALDIVLKLQPVTYNLVGNVSREYGFIADDVMDVIPEVVLTTTDGRPLSMSYARLVSVLTGAIHEQQKQIDDLKLRVLQ